MGATGAALREVCLRRLDHWWPQGEPFPPMIPWLAVVTTRAGLARALADSRGAGEARGCAGCGGPCPGLGPDGAVHAAEFGENAVWDAWWRVVAGVLARAQEEGADVQDGSA